MSQLLLIIIAEVAAAVDVDVDVDVDAIVIAVEWQSDLSVCLSHCLPLCLSHCPSVSRAYERLLISYFFDIYFSFSVLLFFALLAFLSRRLLNSTMTAHESQPMLKNPTGTAAAAPTRTPSSSPSATWDWSTAHTASMR